MRVTDRGLYCEDGDFYIDPWRPVDRAVVTHGHSDHASWGHKKYLCSIDSAPILRARLGADIAVDAVEYGRELNLNGIGVSLHPAGHILGSAQIRLEREGEVWVVSGDYKTEPDVTATPFEPIRCHTFITETTFGLPIYKWAPQAEVYAEINSWWRRNQELGRCSLIMGYALGKAQRILAGLDPSIGPIYVHGAVDRLNRVYAMRGINLPATRNPVEEPKGFDFSRSIVVAPPSVQGTPWLRRFGHVSTAFASGWMSVRGTRRRRAVDRGFVLSDHVDWPSLLAAVRATEAETVLTTHGYAEIGARYFREVEGLNAHALETRFVGESVDPSATEDDAESTEVVADA